MTSFRWTSGRRSLKGRDVLFTASYDNAGRLEKMRISFLTADEDCVWSYRSLKKELQQKFRRASDGRRAMGVSVQQRRPCRPGALRDPRRQGIVATVWKNPDAGSTEGGIVITTADDVIVKLASKSSKWATEAARQRKLLDEVADPTTAISPSANTRQGLRVRLWTEASQRQRRATICRLAVVVPIRPSSSVTQIANVFTPGVVSSGMRASR